MLKISNVTIVLTAVFFCILSYAFGIVDVASVEGELYGDVLSMTFGFLCIIILALRLREMTTSLKAIGILTILAAGISIIESIRVLF